MKDTRTRLLGGAAITAALLLGVALFVATAGTSPTLAHRVPTIVSDRPLALAVAAKGAVPSGSTSGAEARSGGTVGATTGGTSPTAKSGSASAQSPTGGGGTTGSGSSSRATTQRTPSRSSASAHTAASGGTGTSSSGTGRATVTRDIRDSKHEKDEHEVVRPTVREEPDGDDTSDAADETKPVDDSDASKDD